MKASRMYLLVVAAILGGAIVLSHSLAQDPAPTGVGTRVAVCDVVQVFNSYTRAKDLTTTLNDKRQEVKAEADKRTSVIESIQLELQGLLPGSKEYERKFNDVQRMAIERKAWLQYQEALVMRDHHRLTKEMYEQIIEMISQVARERGIQIVLYRMRSELESKETRELLQQIERRRVLYAADGIDMTETVLNRLDEKYRASKKLTGE